MANRILNHPSAVEHLDTTAPLNPNALRAAQGPSLAHLKLILLKMVFGFI